jgi:hypothetical protein
LQHSFLLPVAINISTIGVAVQGLLECEAGAVSREIYLAFVEGLADDASSCSAPRLEQSALVMKS